MSKSEAIRLPAGIRARHRAGCPAHQGNECRCDPGFEASIYSKRDAKKIRRTFDKPGDAKRWINEQRKVRDDGALLAPARISFRDAAERFLKMAEAGGILNRSGDAYKPSAVRSYRTSLERHVLPHLGHVRLSEVTRGQLQRLVARWQEQGQSASTIGNTINSVRALYSNADLLTSGAIATNPTRDLRLPARRGKRDRIASPEEASLLLAALPEQERALWATAFYAGLRRGELRGLDWQSVNLAAGTITVCASWDDHEGEITPKSRAGNRTVPIIARLRDLLTEHAIITGRKTGLVFGSSRQQAVRHEHGQQARQAGMVQGQPRAHRTPRGAPHVRQLPAGRTRGLQAHQHLHGSRQRGVHDGPLREADARIAGRHRGADRQLHGARRHRLPAGRHRQLGARPPPVNSSSEVLAGAERRCSSPRP